MSSCAFTHCLSNMAWTAYFAAACGIGCTSTVHAALTTYTISGTVTDTSTNHYVPTAVVKDSLFVGTIRFDNAAPGTLSGGNGYYRGAALNLGVDIWVDGQCEYVNLTSSASDEIDLLPGTTTPFGYQKRGRVAPPSFSR